MCLLQPVQSKSQCLQESSQPCSKTEWCSLYYALSSPEGGYGTLLILALSLSMLLSNFYMCMFLYLLYRTVFFFYLCYFIHCYVVYIERRLSLIAWLLTVLLSLFSLCLYLSKIGYTNLEHFRFYSWMLYCCVYSLLVHVSVLAYSRISLNTSGYICSYLTCGKNVVSSSCRLKIPHGSVRSWPLTLCSV